MARRKLSLKGFKQAVPSDADLEAISVAAQKKAAQNGLTGKSSVEQETIDTVNKVLEKSSTLFGRKKR